MLPERTFVSKVSMLVGQGQDHPRKPFSSASKKYVCVKFDGVLKN